MTVADAGECPLRPISDYLARVAALAWRRAILPRRELACAPIWHMIAEGAGKGEVAPRGYGFQGRVVISKALGAPAP